QLIWFDLGRHLARVSGCSLGTGKSAAATRERGYTVKRNKRINSAIRDWNDIQCALAVAVAGSFHVAAPQLGVYETTISRRVQTLERELGAKLFVRHAHGMALTPAGESLVEKARAMEDAAKVLRHDIGSFDAKLSGVVRL